MTIIDEGEDEDDEDDEDDEGINYDDEEEEVLGDNDKYIINDEGVSDCDKKKNSTAPPKILFKKRYQKV